MKHILAFKFFVSPSVVFNTILVQLYFRNYSWKNKLLYGIPFRISMDDLHE